MQIESRHELAYGFAESRSSRLAVMIIIGVVGTPASFAAGLMLGLVIAFSLGPGGNMGALIAIPVVLGLVGAGLFGAWAVVNIIRVARTAAWLEGSRLTVRAARQRTVDLGRARSVAVRPTQMRWRAADRADTIPQLLVVGESDEVRLRLATGEGTPLPPQDVAALVSALSATSAPGGADAIEYLRTSY
ncbi:hypothetical protein [Paractinoplanes rishiriensis]|uniref:Uncharacterized protein n=1 Tax=Paractinoplanes rishiriensis TaxID=1050105 RepID=A0A919MS12_9ACTN|nr:hypothetical protein [Actinoplanes rishiriensis]GIE93158.1 hypothetical protein Ari01nite_06230 [Actinoplanes rishiriensis]